MQTRSGGSGEGICANPFGRVVWVGRVRSSMQTRSGGSGEGVLENSFRWVGRGRLCQLVREGRARVSVSTRSGGSGESVYVNSFRQVGRGHAQVKEPVSKVLSCDPRLALSTFMQLVSLALPCRFVSVMRVPM